MWPLTSCEVDGYYKPAYLNGKTTMIIPMIIPTMTMTMIIIVVRLTSLLASLTLLY